jgi:hypothetical protein
MNMALALVLTGAGMAWVLDFWDTQLLAQNLVAGVDSFPLLAVPFFILAGELMNSGGISRRIIDMAQAWVGHIRAAWAMWPSARRCCWPRMSGSAMADTAALATILLPMMRQQGYPKHLGRADRLGRHHRAHHPAVHAVRDLRRDHQHLDQQAVLSGIVPGLMMGAGLIFAWRWCCAASPAPGPALPLAAPARHGARLLGHADAGHHHRRHEVGRVHAHRSRRGGAVYALLVACSCTAR